MATPKKRFKNQKVHRALLNGSVQEFTECGLRIFMSTVLRWNIREVTCKTCRVVVRMKKERKNAKA